MAERQQLEAACVRLPDLCRELAEYGLSEMVDHGDFHDANIFMAGDAYVFFDWGVCQSDPSLLLSAHHLREHRAYLPRGERDPLFAEMRDHYLSPCQGEMSMSLLREAFELARRVWSLIAALRW